MKWQVLLSLLSSLGTISTSPPCAHVTHSECGEDDAHLFLETTSPNLEACHAICMALGLKCHFLLFDNEAFARGNCRLYDENFSKYILHCNQLAGPKTSEEGCDLENPPDNSCEVYRSGKCDFGLHEESYYFSSWENCQAACKSTFECQYWQFEREQQLCYIFYSQERICAWEFYPREPRLEDCDDNSPTTPTTSVPTTTTTSTTVTTVTSIPTTSTPVPTKFTTTPSISTTSTNPNPNCDIPEAQQYGDWFCPPSSSTNTATCHLECHPGYVSNDRTVITCTQAAWSSAPVCVEAIGLITGNDDSPYNTVEIYGEGKHQMLPNLPNNRSVHSLEMVDSYILLCGGSYTPTSCMELTSSLSWRTHSITTSPRSRHSSVSILGQLHLLGGVNSPSTTELLAHASSTAWTQGHDLLTQAANDCAVKIHPQVLMVAGGRYDQSAAVFSYNVTSGAATRLQNLNTPRDSHGCVYIKDSQTGFRGVLVAGGFSTYGFDRSEMYSFTTGQWTDTGKLTRPRRGVRLMKLGQNILAFGGSAGWKGSASATVDSFNLTTMGWSETEEMLEGKSFHAVTGVPPNLVHTHQKINKK